MQMFWHVGACVCETADEDMRCSGKLAGVANIAWYTLGYVNAWSGMHAFMYAYYVHVRVKVCVCVKKSD